MAELGSINFTDVNRGTRQVDRSGEVRALSQGLDLTTKVVNEGIKAKVTSDMTSAIDEAMVVDTSGVAIAESPDQVAIRLADPKAHRLASDIDRWKLQVQQGTSSQRTKAEMHIKEILNDAQVNYPWLAEDLQARAGLVITGSHQLEVLGLNDAAVASSQANAQSHLDNLQSYATTSWKDGGLGMSQISRLDDPAFQAEFLELDQARQVYDARSRSTAMMLSNRNATALEQEQAAAEELRGRASRTRLMYEEIRRDNGFYAFLEESQKGAAGDPEVMREFLDVGRFVMIDALAAAKVTISEENEEWMFGINSDTDAAKRHTARVDNLIGQIDGQIALLRSEVNDMPSVIQQIEASMKLTAYDVYKDLPDADQRFLSFMGSDPGRVIIDLAANDMTGKFMGGLLKTGTHLAGTLEKKFPTTFGNEATVGGSTPTLFLLGGQGDITPEMSYLDINKRFAKYQSDAPNPFGPATPTDDDLLEAGYYTAQQATNLWAAASATPANATPEVAGFQLNVLNNSMHPYNIQGRYPEDAVVPFLNGLADENMLNGLTVIGDGPYSNVRRAFGETAKTFYLGTRPDKRRRKLVSEYESGVVGDSKRRVRELVLIDAKALREDGVFSYKVDEKALELEITKAVNKYATPSVAAVSESGVTSRSHHERVLRAQIETIMQPVLDEANQQIRIERTLDWATSRDAASRRGGNVLMQYAQQTGWLESFERYTEG